MKAQVHINQHNIRWNRKKKGEERKVISVKTYKSNDYTNEIEINGPSRLIYSPDKPLSCGATVWIECERGDVVLK